MTARYLVKGYAAYLALVWLCLTCLFVLGELADKTKVLLGHSLEEIAVLYLYKTVIVVDWVGPLSMIFAAALWVQSLQRKGEVVALRALGVSEVQVLRAPMALLVVVVVGLIIYQNNAVTFAGPKVDSMQVNRFRRMGDYQQHYGEKQWFRLGNDVFYFRENAISVFRFSNSFQLKERIDAERLSYEGGDLWRLHHATLREFTQDGRVKYAETESTARHFEAKDAKTFDIVLGRPDYMRFSVLRRQIEQRSHVGLQTSTLSWAYNARWAMPLFGLLGALLAALLGLRRSRHFQAASALIDALVIALGIYGAISIARALALARVGPAQVLLLGVLVLELAVVAIVVKPTFYKRLWRRAT